MSSRARVHACAALAAVAIFSTAAFAQDAPTPDRNIIVQGERPPATEDQVTEQAKNISIVGDPLDEPLPRFEDWVCPGVLGLTDDAAAYIIQRVRYNAEQLDLRVTKDDGTCEPNFIVAFVDDAQNALVEVARRNGYMLAGLSVTERGELLNAPGAARVWSNVIARTRDGMPVPSERDARSAPERAGSSFAGTDGNGNALSAPFAMGVAPVSAGWNAHSKIYIATREDITSVLVLFDRNQVRGKSLLQLADYATMRGFALTREISGSHAAPTILSLFDGPDPHPDRLTAFDWGYLGSLYRDQPNLPAQAKIAGVNAEMARQATRE